MSMKIELRNDSVHISGYVNAVDRYSRPLRDRVTGQYFVEKIEPGTFHRAIDEADDIAVMHNHKRALTTVKSGNITLKEDNVGLYFEGDISDSEIIERAQKEELAGWSFGFVPINPEDRECHKNGVAYERIIRSMKLIEVSIIDKTMNPCYPATSIQARADEGEEIHLRADGDGATYFESKKNHTAENELRKRKLNVKKRK